MRKGDELLHIFTHHIKKTEDELREIMRTYMLNHLQWISRLGRVVLADANVSVEDYIDTMTTAGTPLDFIGLTVLCRIYHIHIAVYTSKGLWSTCREKNIKQCVFGIVYNGEFKFTETVKQGLGEQYQNWLQERQTAGKLPSHDKTVFTEMVLKAELSSIPQVLNIVNNAVMCGHGFTHLPKEELPEDCSETQEYSDGENNTLIKTEYSVENQESDEESQSETEQKHGIIKSENSAKTEANENEGTESDSDASDINCDVLKCKEILELSDDDDNRPTPIVYSSEIKMERLWQNAQACVSTALASVQESPSVEPTPTTSEIVTLEDDLILHCPVCEFSAPTQKVCIRHITERHPLYRFECNLCKKDFPSFGSKYRHEQQEHKPMRHFCVVCGLRHIYKSELDKHVAVHNTVLPFQCGQCGKRFAQKKSLNRHEDVHKNKSFVCSVCDKVSETKDRLYTHFRGAHGKGYRAKCGKHFQWPATRARHQQGCDPCKEIIAREQKEKEAKKRFMTVSHNDKAVKKKVKVEFENTATDTLKETKKKIQCKIENIIQLKKDM